MIIVTIIIWSLFMNNLPHEYYLDQKYPIAAFNIYNAYNFCLNKPQYKSDFQDQCNNITEYSQYFNSKLVT